MKSISKEKQLTHCTHKRKEYSDVSSRTPIWVRERNEHTNSKRKVTLPFRLIMEKRTPKNKETYVGFLSKKKLLITWKFEKNNLNFLRVWRLVIGAAEWYESNHNLQNSQRENKKKKGVRQGRNLSQPYFNVRVKTKI